MNDDNYSIEVQNYNALPSTSALADRIPDNWMDHGIFPGMNDNFNQKCHFQHGDVNPEESLASQTTFLTDGGPVEDWRVSGHLELKTAGEPAVIAPCDYFWGGALEMLDPLSFTEPVEEYSEEDDPWAQELGAYILTLSNPRPDANSNDEGLKIIAAANNKLTFSTNVTDFLPNSQEHDNFAEPTGEPATANFSRNDCSPGPSSYSSMGQVNTASSWTFFGAPPNFGQLPSFPRYMGHAVVASDTPMYLDQLVTMDGVTAPVAPFPMAGWHQGMYGRQPRNAPPTMGQHWNAQISGYSPYNPDPQATVAPNMQAYAEALMPVYGANSHLTQAPITGALPADKRQPRNSPATTSAQAVRRETRYDPYKLSPASKCAETSGEPELYYYCQWGDCSEGPMTETKIFEHFRAHGGKIKENGRVKECKWAGCDPKPGAFPMTSDGFRRHVNETQFHAGIGSLTKVKCKTCGKKRARRSMPSHRRVCSGKSKESEDNGKKS